MQETLVHLIYWLYSPRSHWLYFPRSHYLERDDISNRIIAPANVSVKVKVDIQFTFKTQFVKPSHIVYLCACSYVFHYIYEIWHMTIWQGIFFWILGLPGTLLQTGSLADDFIILWIGAPDSLLSTLNFVEDLDCLACNISLSSFITSIESLFFFPDFLWYYQVFSISSYDNYLSKIMLTDIFVMSKKLFVISINSSWAT